SCIRKAAIVKSKAPPLRHRQKSASVSDRHDRDLPDEDIYRRQARPIVYLLDQLELPILDRKQDDGALIEAEVVFGRVFENALARREWPAGFDGVTECRAELLRAG